MSKWALLKESLKKGRNTSSASSIHAFNGHQLISKEKVIWQGFTSMVTVTEELDYDSFLRFIVQRFSAIDSCEVTIELFLQNLDFFCKEKLLITLASNQCFDGISLISVSEISEIGDSHMESKLSILFRNSRYVPIYSSCSYFRYTTPSNRTIFTREVSEHRKFKASDILSDKLFGVDNTGNICTWPSEAILFHILVTLPWLRELLNEKRLVEIGGGQTALAGLGLAIEGVSKNIIITDGHPHCVLNQGVCIECCRSRNLIPTDCDIKTQVLHWSEFSYFPSGSVDVVIGSDCLFFKDFHDSLVNLLKHALQMNGVVIFLQPSRGGSMEEFIEKAKKFFNIELHVDYLPEMSNQRDEFLRNEEAYYSVDRHYPTLLIMRLK